MADSFLGLRTRSLSRWEFASSEDANTRQGDHGPKFGIDFHRPLSEWSKAELQQRFPILNAQRLPRDCSPSGPRAGFAVNTFRFVLSCITGRAPDPLSPRHFMIDLEQGQIERTDEAVFVPGQR